MSASNANELVLRRCEAEQMIVDLGEAIGGIISAVSDATDSDKAIAMDALVLLNTKRNILEDAIKESEVQS